MPIFGEETIPIDIFNGISPSLNHRKKDLCLKILNFIKTGQAEYTIREDLVMLAKIPNASGVTAPTVATNEIPAYYGDSQTFIHQATGINGTDTPTLIEAYMGSGSVGNQVTWVNYNSSTAVKYLQTIANNRHMKAFVQYKDRYYASDGTIEIFRVSGFATAIPPLTVTDLAAVGVNILRTFRNRIFGFTRNRIYYTDLPAIGGYPETWNITVNFFDMPSTNDLTIYDVRVYRDKLYIFTDKGVYYLQPNGDPLNWVIQLVSSTFCVFSTQSVTLNNNLIFLTDQKAVYMFDGTKFSLISSVVNEFFYNSPFLYNKFSVYPWETGILVCRNSFSNPAGSFFPETSPILYFDMNIWISYAPSSQHTDGSSSGIISAINNFTPYRGFTPCSVMCYVGNPLGTVTCMALKKGKWQGDCFDPDHVAGARQGKDFEIIGPAFLMELRRNVKIKFINIYGKFNLANLGGGTDFIWVGSYEKTAESQTKTITVVDMSKYNSVIRAPLNAGVSTSPSNSRSRYIRNMFTFRIVGRAKNALDEDTGNPGNQPPLIITKMEAVGDTNNSQLQELGSS